MRIIRLDAILAILAIYVDVVYIKWLIIARFVDLNYQIIILNIPNKKIEYMIENGIESVILIKERKTKYHK